MKTYVQIASVVIVCSLAACGGGGGDDRSGGQSPLSDLGTDISPGAGVIPGVSVTDIEVPQETRLSLVAGLWDASYVDPEFGEDSFYFEILPNGRLTRYNYQGDEFDGYLNCYVVDEVGIRSLGGDQYEVDNGPGTEPVLITYTRAGDTLIQVINGQRSIFPELIGISSASFLSCTQLLQSGGD